MLSYYNPNAFNKESVDHINISSQSSTQLGLLLNPSYMKVVHYPHLGRFASVLNLWYWLKTCPLDDSLRRITGFKLKAKASSINSRAKVANFKAIIGVATYMKLKDYPYILKELRDLPNDVQFISYYTPKGSGLRVCSNYAGVIIEIATLIKEAIQKDQEPDFTKLATETDCEMSYLRAFLLKNFGSDKLKEFSTVD